METLRGNHLKHLAHKVISALKILAEKIGRDVTSFAIFIVGIFFSFSFILFLKKTLFTMIHVNKNKTFWHRASTTGFDCYLTG